MKAYLDKVGPLGSIFAALCCIGTPGLVAFLSAIGVGFLINDAILLPLLVFFFWPSAWQACTIPPGRIRTVGL